jgi:hypothetical protein
MTPYRLTAKRRCWNANKRIINKRVRRCYREIMRRVQALISTNSAED